MAADPARCAEIKGGSDCVYGGQVVFAAGDGLHEEEINKRFLWAASGSPVYLSGGRPPLLQAVGKSISCSSQKETAGSEGEATELRQNPRIAAFDRPRKI